MISIVYQSMMHSMMLKNGRSQGKTIIRDIPQPNHYSNPVRTSNPAGIRFYSRSHRPINMLPSECLEWMGQEHMRTNVHQLGRPIQNWPMSGGTQQNFAPSNPFQKATNLCCTRLYPTCRQPQWAKPVCWNLTKVIVVTRMQLVVHPVIKLLFGTWHVFPWVCVLPTTSSERNIETYQIMNTLLFL